MFRVQKAKAKEQPILDYSSELPKILWAFAGTVEVRGISCCYIRL
jgi:hypothetical protein